MSGASLDESVAASAADLQRDCHKPLSPVVVDKIKYVQSMTVQILQVNDI